jgi:hypothetical protein
MKRALLFLPFLVACGDVRSGDSLGDPIWVMQADLQGVALGDPEGEHRALFGWVSFGEGDLFDCYDETTWWLCGLRVSYQQKLLLGPTEVMPVIDGLAVPFYEFPKREELLSRKGAVLALGGLGIYDDRNLNGELDPIMTADPIDRLVAESITPPDYRSLAVYREGPVHAFWELFRELLRCPDPPEGYSVVRVYTEGNEIKECRVTPDTHLLVSDSSDVETARIQCALNSSGIPLTILAKSHDPAPLPENAVVTACNAMRVDFYLDNGNFCDQFDPNFYVLRQNEAPPAWWPCP